MYNYIITEYYSFTEICELFQLDIEHPILNIKIEVHIIR